MPSAGSLATVIALVPLVAACSIHPGVAGGVVVGGALLAQKLSHPTSDSGALAVYLSDGRLMEGRWTLVAKPRDAEGVLLITRSGTLSAADLVEPEVPAVTGRVTHRRARMICAFVGDHQSGYQAHCADDTGERWYGDARTSRDWAPRWSATGISDPRPTFVTRFRGRVVVLVEPGRD